MKQRKISSIAIFLIGMGIMGCTSSEGYKIRGTIGDVQEGKVTLVTYNGKMCDTLSVAEIKDGKFEMQGSVPELTVGIMSVEGVFAQTVIYLEDKEYEVKLDPGNLGFSEISGGGDTQQLANKYLAIDINLSKAVAQVRDEYMVAIRNPESEHFLQLKGFVDSLQQAADVEKEAFLTQHADSYIALCELANRAERLPLDELKKRFGLLSAELQQNALGKAINEQICKKEALAAGQVAPDFTVQNAEGKSFTLYSIKAKMKIIDFWASWCGPCRHEMKSLLPIYNELKGNDLEFISVSLDKREKDWRKMLDEEKLPWVMLWDKEGFTIGNEPNVIQKAYGFYSIPFIVLIDKEGCILERYLRGEKVKEAILKARKN